MLSKQQQERIRNRFITEKCNMLNMQRKEKYVGDKAAHSALSGGSGRVATPHSRAVILAIAVDTAGVVC
jgi:hypothetical protein